jgi:hypothetical protein
MAQSNPPTPSEVRQWARENGHDVKDTGSLPRRVVTAWNRTHRTRKIEVPAA